MRGRRRPRQYRARRRTVLRLLQPWPFQWRPAGSSGGRSAVVQDPPEELLLLRSGQGGLAVCQEVTETVAVDGQSAGHAGRVRQPYLGVGHGLADVEWAHRGTDGQTMPLTINGVLHRGMVEEVTTGTLENVIGSPVCPLNIGETMTYAEVRLTDPAGGATRPALDKEVLR